jgi:hypothetical protein
MKPKASDCAALAMDLADGPEIPYALGGESLKGLDCQGLIEYVVRKLGGKMSYRGSNHMYRDAVDLAIPIDEAGEALEPGCVLFVVRDEPAPGYDDGANATHIGWYTGGRHEVVHASSSKGKVSPSTLNGGWTHVGWLVEVDYEMSEENSDGGGKPVKAFVTAETGDTVNMRVGPDRTTPILARVPVGETVGVLEQTDDWWKIEYLGKAGWMMVNYLTREPAPIPVAQTARELAQQVYELIKTHLEA